MHLYSNLTVLMNSAINRKVIVFVLFLMGLGVTSCNNTFTMTRDCGWVSLVAEGRVLDSVTREPIPDAEVSVKSTEVGDCPQSAPISSFILYTDEEGRFATSITSASDNRLEIRVSANGCQPYTISDAFYGTFMGFQGDEKGLIVYLGCD